MATQAQARPMPNWQGNQAPSGSILSEVGSLLTRPKAFFQKTPRNRHWLVAAILILGIVGLCAFSQGTTSTSSSTSSASTSGFSLTMLQTGSTAASTPGAQTGSSTSTSGAATTAASTAAATTSTLTTNAKLISALAGACGILAMWGGQALLLSLVPMFRGYAPRLERGFQIAVWASLPLALMLVVRQIGFAMGSTGGSLGLSLLLTQWSDYPKLGQLARRIIATFLSNFTLFWLWSLLLMYFGARFALGGRRFVAVFVVVLWVLTSTTVPALFSDPVTTTASTTSNTTSATPQATKSSTATSGAAGAAGGQMGGGGDMPGGGMPPSGSFPGGSGGGPSGPGGG